MKTQEEINKEWSKAASNYDGIIYDELSSFRPAAWLSLIEKEFRPAGKHKNKSACLHNADDSSKSEKHNIKILDIGCGPAFFTIILAREGYKVTAIDGADEMLKRAAKNVERHGLTAEILKMDCQEPTFKDNTFDLIISRNVTHTLRDHKKAYSQWQRILKPGGTLLIFDANWHLPLASKEMYEESIALVKECIITYGSDFNGHTDPNDCKLECEYRPGKHPLGDLIRPDWDLGLLKGVGYVELDYKRDITGPLWDDKEKLIFANTPMFMIKALKADK